MEIYVVIGFAGRRAYSLNRLVTVNMQTAINKCKECGEYIEIWKNQEHIKTVLLHEIFENLDSENVSDWLKNE